MSQGLPVVKLQSERQLRGWLCHLKSRKRGEVELADDGTGEDKVDVAAVFGRVGGEPVEH